MVRDEYGEKRAENDRANVRGRGETSWGGGTKEELAEWAREGYRTHSNDEFGLKEGGERARHVAQGNSTQISITEPGGMVRADQRDNPERE